MSNSDSQNSIEKILTRERISLSFAERENVRYSAGVVETSPCMQACPAGVNVKSYVSLIAAGKFHEALKVVRERNPLPGICGRICIHPCESYCNRNDIDSPVAICWLKRFVADYELEHPVPKPEKTAGKRKEKVAIIGSGPAGLTAAHDLALRGYGVTIFEELPEAGGMLIAGIPAYRMPRDILKIEIDYIKNIGVEIKTSTRIEGKNAIENLMKKYKAVFIAVGTHKGKKLNIPGEDDYKGFLDAITFLRGVNLDKPRKPGNKVIVIGGGNSAIDAARTALRLDCEEVHIVYRRSRKEMPANEAEIEESEREGVNIHYLATPVKILGEKGKVTGMECVKMKLGKPDESGRRRPIPIEGSEFVVEADVIIPAISQEPDLSFLPEGHGLNITKWNTFATDETTLTTNVPGVFAGGDAVTGPNTVIDAIAQGHTAAQSIDRYLNGEPLTKKDDYPTPLETEIKVDITSHSKIKRAKMPMQKIPDRKNSFEEVEFGFNEVTAVKEAQRCLRCGPCDECFICVSECDKGLAMLVSTDEKGESLFRLPAEFPSQDLYNGTCEGILKSDTGKEITFQLNLLVPIVQEDLCRSCGDCVALCEYSACELKPKGDEVFVSYIDPDVCRGCGTCVAFCSSSAILPGYFTSDWLSYKLRNIDPDRRNIVVFTCNWNGSVVNDSKQLGIKANSTNILFIKTMCTGRIEMSHIFRALDEGAEGVLIAGCHPDECHYEFGAKKFTETFDKVKNLAHLLGIDSNRIGYEQIPEGDPAKFIKVVNEFVTKER